MEVKARTGKTILTENLKSQIVIEKDRIVYNERMENEISKRKDDTYLSLRKNRK
ncbi:MAG: hypothetical protein LBR59_00565 [Endomicrobium sp.]|jgi:hypothetical protein|nr:hypothetical protein [Endomicrobium sp.]